MQKIFDNHEIYFSLQNQSVIPIQRARRLALFVQSIFMHNQTKGASFVLIWDIIFWLLGKLIQLLLTQKRFVFVTVVREILYLFINIYSNTPFVCN